MAPGEGDITGMNIYEYYREANNDGFQIRFYHAANSEERLGLALQGKLLFLLLTKNLLLSRESPTDFSMS